MRTPGFLESRLLALLRVPHPPDASRLPGARLFNPAPGYLRMRRWGWALRALGGGAVIAIAAGSLHAAGTVAGPARAEPLYLLSPLVRVIELFAVAGWLLQSALGWFLINLDYDWRWYVLTDRSLLIREGLLTVSEKTMSYANLQNLEIRQGPIQRLFGISDVEVRSAGGGAESPQEARARALRGEEPLHAARFRGVDNPEEIRAAVIERQRLMKDAGLGDLDDAHPPAVAPASSEPAADEDADLAAAAREFTAAARELRAALTAR